MSRKETSREYVMSSKRGGFARPGPPATRIRSAKYCSARRRACVIGTPVVRPRELGGGAPGQPSLSSAIHPLTSPSAVRRSARAPQEQDLVALSAAVLDSRSAFRRAPPDRDDLGRPTGTLARHESYSYRGHVLSWVCVMPASCPTAVRGRREGWNASREICTGLECTGEGVLPRGISGNQERSKHEGM